jgi:hypothetical protein
VTKRGDGNLARLQPVKVALLVEHDVTERAVPVVDLHNSAAVNELARLRLGARGKL